MATQAVAIPRQRWVRIIPVAFLMYTIAFMDRINIGFGIPGIEKSLGVDATIAGLASGIFFFGYLFLQIPGGHLAITWSARKFVTISLIVWGVFAVLTGLAQNATQLLIVRFILGVAEGGVWPATLVLLANWFPLDERARANSYWMFCLPVASIIMSPISGWILTWADWRTLFIIEGIPPLIWAVLWWFMIADKPEDAKWLSPEEKVYLEQKFAEDRHNALPQDKGDWKEGLKNAKVWWLVIVYFLIQVGFYGVSLWLPVMIKGLTKQNFGLVGIWSALPYVAAVIGLYLNANHSDRTGERKLHVAIPTIIGGIALLLSGLLGPASPLLGIIFLILTEGFLLPYVGVFWTLPPLILGQEAIGSGMGLINALGNLGGFVGPFIIGYFIATTGSNLTGIVLLSIALVVAGIMVLVFRYERATTETTPAVAPTD
ncbi:MFS transporter [Ktedonosporobacter rubrisoli]|uniref:MFS transporter n=1 Tax=Ktedonosporobacter rubrisoli TaxID=2509675 RepID=A0A4P6JTH9_KTERU|nr:MFS transporter [Ktedonosporobacter rubrisoli]QBD78877.1 MFS transporter [Ktedonosporobacter rubrisoli]